jgi:hypothetical protein
MSNKTIEKVEQIRTTDETLKAEHKPISRILETVLNQVEIEQDVAASWSQNWNAHSNHSNSSG